MTDLEDLRQSIIEGDMKSATSLVERALADGLEPGSILNDGMIAAMTEVGRRFEEGEYFVPEMLIAARAMQAGLKILKPKLVDSGNKPLGTVAIGTVKGDLHDIGKSLVAMMLEGAGFEIMDLGVDVAPEKFVEAIRGGAQVIAMSALLTTTMPNMKATVEAVKQAGLRDQSVIVIGGAPVTQAYANEIGADAYAPDASAAVRVTRSLIS